MLLAHQIVALALACSPQIEAGTAQAIVKRESGGNPYAIGVGKSAWLSHQPRTKAQALHVAHQLGKAGIEFDVGVAQIRTTNLRRYGFTVEQALEPCTNFQLMQIILLENYHRAIRQGRQPGTQASLASVSAYNTGSLTSGFSNGYVAAVVAGHPGRAGR